MLHTVSVDTEGVQGLLDKATEMECPRAYEYLMAAKQIMPNKIQAETREECTFQTSWSKMKDNTARLSVIVKTDINGTNYWADIEALDSEKWTLTEKAKSDYYEVIDYLDDDTLLFFGKTDLGVKIGSYFQAFVLGELDQVDEYIVTNAESEFKGKGDAFIDFTIGSGESTVEMVKSIGNHIKEPWEYMKSAFTGECEDTGVNGGLKFGAAFVQGVTGIPAYTSITNAEENAPKIKEACKSCGEILTGLWSIRPEEWVSMAGEALSYAGNQLEQQAEYQIDRIEEFSKYTPEQWENLAINACKAAYENKEREIQELFSKENVSEMYYAGGYAETTITLFVLECLLSIKLAEVFKVGNVAKGDEVVTSLSDLMSPEDAESYLKFLQNGSTAGLTKEEIAAINKVDEALALKKIDYQDILDMRKASDITKFGSKTTKELISESDAAQKWGMLDDGTNQGVKHFCDYWEQHPDRIPSLEQRLGVQEGAFNNSLDGFNNFTTQAERVISEATSIGNVRNVNGKTIYYIDGVANPKKGVVVIVRDGKIQSMMPSELKTFNKMQ